MQTPAITDARPQTPIAAATAPLVSQEGQFQPAPPPGETAVPAEGLSEDEIAETLLPHAEVIAEKALG